MQTKCSDKMQNIDNNGYILYNNGYKLCSNGYILYTNGYILYIPIRDQIIYIESVFYYLVELSKTRLAEYQI